MALVSVILVCTDALILFLFSILQLYLVSKLEA